MNESESDALVVLRALVVAMQQCFAALNGRLDKILENQRIIMERQQSQGSTLVQATEPHPLSRAFADVVRAISGSPTMLGLALVPLALLFAVPLFVLANFVTWEPNSLLGHLWSALIQWAP